MLWQSDANFGMRFNQRQGERRHLVHPRPRPGPRLRRWLLDVSDSSDNLSVLSDGPHPGPQPTSLLVEADKRTRKAGRLARPPDGVVPERPSSLADPPEIPQPVIPPRLRDQKKIIFKKTTRDSDLPIFSELVAS